MAEKRGLFTPRKISKKRITKISRDPIAAVKLIGSDPGLFAQEFLRGTYPGKFLYGFPNVMDKGNPGTEAREKRAKTHSNKRKK
jgi:hypothetical protein